MQLLESPRAGFLPAEWGASFRENGYVVAPQVFSPDEVAEIREAFMALGKDGPVAGLSDTGKGYAPGDPLARYPRMMHPHRHPELAVGPLSLRRLLDSRIESVLHELFGEEPIAAQSMFYFKPPGARGQELHQDNFYLRVKPGTCIAAWLAVDDADRGNGGMVVVPGSHRMEIACPERADTARSFTGDYVRVPEGLSASPVDLRAGDVLFFNGSVIHGSYSNESPDRFRRAFICHYVPRSSVEVSHWYRPLLNFRGQEVSIADATGGGPCGTAVEVKGPH